MKISREYLETSAKEVEEALEKIRKAQRTANERIIDILSSL